MKTEDQSSVYMENNFKPPDRSTSAPPVLSLHPESLFAFRAAEHLQLFSDIRCEEDFYGFYGKYQTQGGKGQPPTLENQTNFMLDRSYVEEDEHNLINPHANQQPQQIPSHQQQIQQLQQQIQQQQQQLQQQMQFQQQYMQHVHPQQQQQQQQQMHSPHHNSHPQHMQQQQQQIHHAPHMHPQHSHQQLPQQLSQHQQLPQQLPQHLQQQLQHSHLPQHLPHPQHLQQQHSQQFSHLTPLQQQQFQQMQHQQPHMNFGHRGSVPDTRHPLPRSTSNPSYNLRALQEEPTHLDDDLSEGGDTIWTPLPVRNRIPSNLLDEYMGPDDQSHKRGHYAPPHHTTPPPQQQSPASYYQQNDFDNVAFSTAKQLLDDNIQSLWNDGGFDGRQQQQQQQRGQIAVPTPKNAANIISLLGGGYFNEAANPDKPRRNRTNSAGRLLPVPTTSPPPIMHQGPGSASTSPALPICRYYAQGFCSRGERCNFLHDEQSQQALSGLQDRNDAPFSVAKPKAKKTVSSPPPMSLPPKVPSPVNMRGSAHGNGLHHSSSANGLSNGNNNNNNNGNNANNNNNQS